MPVFAAAGFHRQSIWPRFVLLLSLSLLAGGFGTRHSYAAEHVIHISFDGLNAALLQHAIDTGQAPNFQRLQSDGAWTFNARTDYTQSNTLPNHTCMFTGRAVRQPAGMPDLKYHGWTTNSVPKIGAALHDKHNPHVGYVASVFDVVHDAGLSTALYATKDKFILYDQSYNEHNGAPHDYGRDKIDVYHYQNDGPPRFSASMHKRFLGDMAEQHFNYAFVHYRECDTTGHALGWGSGGWSYALRTLDGYLADVLTLVETDPVLAGRTTVIVNTDHGGTGFSHDECLVPGNFTIPIFVWGAHVGRGELYNLNPETRADPGDARPEYSAPAQPIRNGETGNLALSLLGLGPIPGSFINAKQDLRVSLVGD
jgi:predicted AlkP superfamily pyrophosphatase or phosphodiesterase